MYLSLLLKSVIYRLICGNIQIPVSDIIYDSRKIIPGCIFVCLKGMNFDGHDYIHDAILGGARGIAIEQSAEILNLSEYADITVIAVKNTREALGEMSRAFFGYPERSLKLIGITGTKGKTTVAGMLQAVLERAGIRTGIIGTIAVSTGRRMFQAQNTTPESYLVQKYLRMMVEDGCQAAVMEVSSQGLMCHRVEGMCFDYGIMTNIYPDHIGPGEHKDFAEYVHWKGQLFKQCRIGFANGMDDNVKKAIESHTCVVKTFGLADGYGQFDFYANHIRIKKDCCETGDCTYLGVCFDMASGYGELHDYCLGFPGRYNVVNALPVIAVAGQMGVDLCTIRSALMAVRITGRCEMLANVRGGYFILDYAHNGKALEFVLKTLREYHPRRLICIFGCGGNRSKIRRTDMAQAAVYNADELIITTDNPRYEEPMVIIQDIVAEIEKQLSETPGLVDKLQYTVIEDRKAAIKYALKHIDCGEIVLLAGKGHEIYQEIQGKKYPFDEHLIVHELNKEK